MASWRKHNDGQFMKKIGLLVGPLLFFLLLLIPVPEGLRPEAWRVLALAALMISWWVTEAIPIPVTSLLPIILLPLMGVSSIKDAASPFANPVVYLFMGGFVIALAMEKWELHRRIALNIIRITGTNANGIILGFMIATAFLSMWISNTATAVMMLPIAVSVVELLNKDTNRYDYGGMKNFSLTLMLGIAYCASIGGMATIIGTPPNVVLKGFVRDQYGYEIGFGEWMLVGLPFSVLLLIIVYVMLVKFMYPNKLGRFEGGKALIAAELAQLGQMSKGERYTLMIFSGTALLWTLSGLINQAIPWLKLSDEAIALIGATMLFLIPLDLKKSEQILDWRDTQRLPWGILLLFGGGLSLADALAKTGTIGLIGEQFEGMGSMGWLLILGLTAVSLYLTEVMSNVALVNIFLPVVSGVAIGAGINPIIMLVPVTLAASCAFMLPMSTPPNAIVFASGHITIAQMVKVGFWLNILAILIIALFTEPIIKLVFSGWHPVN
jgi:solute carrier family 13 (sodium-dependent dicarboxylate transporter), member 2/3/5